MRTLSIARSVFGFVVLWLVLWPFAFGAGETASTNTELTEIDALLTRGRSQYLAGEPWAAAQTLARVLQLDPANAAANDLMQRIAAEAGDPGNTRVRTGAQLLDEVRQAWRRPEAVVATTTDAPASAPLSPTEQKLARIMIPSVTFSGMELSRVVNTLGAVSAEFDRSDSDPKGVNIVLIDPERKNPAVNISLRNLSLKRVLDFIADSVGYQYEMQADAVVFRPNTEQAALDTQFFPVSRSTVLRMTGQRNAPTKTTGGDPLAGGNGSDSRGTADEGAGIRHFLQQAGVVFDGAPGTALAFDGSQLIVTQTPRNLERIRNILTRYAAVRQVEIEAKFMEVQEGALEELGVQWSIASHQGIGLRSIETGAPLLDANGNQRFVPHQIAGTAGAVRTLADAFRNATSTQQIQISDGTTVPSSPPTLPGGVNTGALAPPLAVINTVVGDFDVSAIVRALAQKSGTELLSAPKLTVLSGNQANITVAQELRYPQSYGQVQSQVGTGSASGGGSAGVSITAGTPQDFATRNVGVELRVTPTVEEDDHSISLDLNPKVTEFEGFVEYGGSSIAISQGTTVTVPSGFYQPIFGVREVTTKVTIWDGATLVMGGLTREDVKKVNDKIPVLGSMPMLGRLFRNKGESAQKRNLLIFVTANLVNPGGAAKSLGGASGRGGTMFRNPMIVTPGGAKDQPMGAKP